MTNKTQVLYNAACPVCAFEINHYRSYAEREALAIRFDDLNADAACTPWGLTQDQAARRLYVRHEGVLYDGVPAFIVLWRQMPRYRVLARVVAMPGVRHVAALVYDYVLAPLIYRWHRRRRALGKA